MRRKIPRLIALLAFASHGWGQTNTGTLTGEVTDSTGARVPAALVQLTSKSTNSTQSTTTTDSGNYTFSALQPGNYRLEVRKQGFETSAVDQTEVFTAQVTAVDVRLKVGEASARVEVTVDAPMLSPDSPALNTTIQTKTLEDTPYPERSALGAIMMVAGVQGDPQYAGGIQSENPAVTTQAVTPGVSLSLSGSRPGGSSMLVDGSDITLTGYSRAGVTFSPDTVQEITVQQNGLPAQYGRTAGGIVNQTTRGGGNLYHGNLSWAHLDPGLEARTFGSPTRPDQHTQMYGGALSGSVRIPRIYNGKNRTFFFVSAEPLRQFQQTFTTRIRLWTPQEMQGNFNNSLDLLNQTILHSQGLDAALAAPRIGSIYYQFALNSAGFPIGGDLSSSKYIPVPNNNLAAQLGQNKLVQYLISKMPTPSNPGPYTIFYRPDGMYASDGTNAYGARGVNNTDNRVTARTDHSFSNTDRLTVRYTGVPVSGIRYDFAGPDSPIGNIFFDKIDSTNASISETHIFSGRSINEFRATYIRAVAQRGPIPAALTEDFGAQLGLYPATDGKGFPAISGISLTNTIGSGGTERDGGNSIDANLGLADDFSIVRGSHSLKFGGEMRFLQLNRKDSSGFYGGAYQFEASNTSNGTAGGSGLASLILGLVDSYTASTVPVPYYYRWHYHAGYFQDDWKAGRNFTVNVGLRYNLETPRIEKYNHQGTFDPTFAGTMNGLPVTGAFVYSGTNGLPNTLWPENYKGFEPRAGFAWAPLSRMTVRSSYALVHTPLTGLGNDTVPNLSTPAITVGKTVGGVNPGFVDYITNPIASLPPPPTLNGQPQFTWPAGNLVEVSQSSAVPYVQLYSFSLQFQVRDTAIEASYSGSKGTHLMGPPIDVNIPSYATLDTYIAANANFNTANIPNVYNSANKMTLVQSLRPYQQFYNDVISTIYDRNYSSSYNALYLTARRRLSHGLLIMGSYSRSKSIDNASSAQISGASSTTDIWGPIVPQSYNASQERSVSTFDVPQKISVAYSYELPFDKLARGKLPILLRGWLTSGFFTAQAGYPIYVYLGNAGYYYTSSGGTVLPTDMMLVPNVLQGVPLINPNWRKDPLDVSPGDGYINPAAFSVPGSPGKPQFGDAPRTLPYLRNPSTRFYDASVRKNFSLGERRELQLRFDGINALNHPNFFLGGSSASPHSLYTTSTAFVTNASFGQLSALTPGRMIRVGARFQF